MKFIRWVFTATLLVAAVCWADDGYRQLFHAVHSLSDSDQKAIYTALELGLGPDKKTFSQGACDPAEFDVETRDLNGDGIPEIFVSGGNTCTSGGTGNSIWLFVKGADGKYRLNLGFPAADYKILPTNNKGFPDLRFGGMGFCEGVYRWSGATYMFYRNVATGPDGCKNR